MHLLEAREFSLIQEELRRDRARANPDISRVDLDDLGVRGSETDFATPEKRHPQDRQVRRRDGCPPSGLPIVTPEFARTLPRLDVGVELKSVGLVVASNHQVAIAALSFPELLPVFFVGPDEKLATHFGNVFGGHPLGDAEDQIVAEIFAFFSEKYDDDRRMGLSNSDPVHVCEAVDNPAPILRDFG